MMWSARFCQQFSTILRPQHLASTLSAKGSQRQAMGLLLLSLFFLACATRTSTAQAQPSQQAPLILNIQGDLWAWAGPGTKLQRRTNWGYNKAPVVSPDGKQIAYKSTAQVAVDAIRRVGGYGGGDLPANIWVLDVATNNAVRVADQPKDASLMNLNRPDKYIVRSDPTWAGDGTLVVWTELGQDVAAQPQGAYTLVIYDLASNLARRIDLKLPPQYGVPAAPQVAGSAAYLAVRSTVFATDAKGSATGLDSLLIYDTQGALISTAQIGLLTEFTWIKYQGKDYVAVVSIGSPDTPADPHWLLVEPRSGRVSEMPGIPELYNPAAPDSLGLVPRSLGTAPDWQIVAPGKPLAQLGTIDDVYAISSVLTISPDGQQFAYVKDGAAYIYSAGQAVKVGATEVSALAWGPMAWRVREKVG
jgi:dipeptidyl aminopeptidase/acylaminoacyl peptidase